MASTVRFIAPFLCALYPFLALYLNNINYFSVREVLEVLAALVLCLYILWRIVKRVVKDTDRALLYFWFLVAALGLFQYISQGIYVITGNRGGFATANTIAFVVWLGLLWLVLRCTLRLLGGRLRAVLETGAVFSIMLCLVAFVGHVTRMKSQAPKPSGAQRSAVMETNENDQWRPLAGDTGATAGSLPDIYFILTDALARRDILQEFFGYDSAPFEAALEAEGLFVVKKARANYSQTLLAFPAMLNFNYIAPSMKEAGTDKGPLMAAFTENRLVTELRERGYRIAAFESSYVGTQGLQAETVHPISGYTNQFLQNSLVVLSFPPLGGMLSSWQRDIHRRKSKNILENIGHVECMKDRPTFLLAHLMMPHPPFVVDEEGNDISLGEPSNVDGVVAYGPSIYRQRYAGQAKFVHRKIVDAVRAIKARACRPTYIIITADHGSLLNEVRKGPPTPELLRERMSIFSAVYFPNGEYTTVREDMTPINLVRATITHAGLADLEPLPDRSLYSQWDAPYNFIPVEPK